MLACHSGCWQLPLKWKQSDFVFGWNLSIDSFEAAWDVPWPKISKKSCCCCQWRMTRCFCSYTLLKAAFPGVLSCLCVLCIQTEILIDTSIVCRTCGTSYKSLTHTDFQAKWNCAVGDCLRLFTVGGDVQNKLALFISEVNLNRRFIRLRGITHEPWNRPEWRRFRNQIINAVWATHQTLYNFPQYFFE